MFIHVLKNYLTQKVAFGLQTHFPLNNQLLHTQRDHTIYYSWLEWTALLHLVKKQNMKDEKPVRAQLLIA